MMTSTFNRLRSAAALFGAAALLFALVVDADALTQFKESDDAASIAGAVWTSPTNIQTDNGSYASYSGTTQDWLIIKQFAFSIPAGVIIDGIEVSLDGHGDGNSPGSRRLDISVTKDGTNPVGLLVQADLPKNTDATVAVSTIGALWDLTWTNTEINSDNFGLMIRDNDTSNKAELLNLDYMTVTVHYRTVDTVTVTPTNPVAGNKQQGAEYEAQKLSLAVDTNTAQWTAITINETGTSVDADITDVRIYKDANANGSYDSGTDTDISGANVFTGGTVGITLTAAETITTTSQDYFVVYTLANLATIGATVTSEIPAGGLTITAPDALAATNLPATTPAQTITDLGDTVTVTRVDRAPGSVAQNTADMETQYLSMATDFETASWTAITVTKLGNIPDGDVSAITIYNDAGVTANQWDASDVAVSGGADTFTSGVSNITLGPAQTITTTAQVFHIVYTIAENAQVAATVGSRVNATGDITLSGTDVVSGTFPLDSTTPAVTDIVDTVTASRVDAGVGNIIQGAQYAPMRVDLVADRDEVTLTAVTVAKLGSIGDAEIDDVDFYLDTGNGTWGGEDTQISNAAAEQFAGGPLTLTLTSAQTLTTASQSYFVVYKLNAAATPAATVGAEITNNTDLTVSGVDAVAVTNFALTSSQKTVIGSGDTMTMSAPTSQAPGSATQGQTDVSILRFTLATDANTASWTDIAVAKTGTLPDADIDTVKIYRDDGGTPNSFDGTDTLISPAVTTFSGGSAAITLSAAETITTSAQNYFIVYSFDAFATTGTTAGAELTSNAAFTIASPDLVSASNFPGNSVNLTIADAADALTVVAADQAPGTAVQGDSYSALRLRMNTNQDQALVSAITVNKTGTLADEWVTATIYKDENSNGTYDPGTDSAISAGTSFAGGSAAITLTPAQNQFTSTQDYFVVYTLSDIATVAGTVDAQLDETDVTLLGGVDTKNAFTADSAATTVTDLADNLAFGATDFAVASADQGTSFATQRFGLWSSSETLDWTAVTVSKTGTLNDADVASVRIYDDTGGTPDVFDGTDAAVSAAEVFSSSSVAIAISPAQTIFTTTQTYHVVYSLTTTAVVGNTVGSLINNSSDLSVSAPDGKEAFYFPGQSTNSSVTDAQDTLTETPADTAPTNIAQGAVDDFLKISLAVDGDETDWSAITVTKHPTSTLADGEVDSVMIYKDANANGTFEEETDTLISPAVTAFTAGAAAITLTAAETITTTSQDYFVVLDINNAATVTNTIGVRIASQADLTVSAADTVAPFTNHDSSLATVDPAPTITFSRVDQTPTNIGQGGKYSTQRIDTITDLGTAEISALTVTLPGTSSISRTDILNVQIYHDDNDDGEWDIGDSVHGSGTFGGPGTVDITFSPTHTTNTSGASFFIVYTLDGAVPTGVTVESEVRRDRGSPRARRRDEFPPRLGRRDDGDARLRRFDYRRHHRSRPAAHRPGLPRRHRRVGHERRQYDAVLYDQRRDDHGRQSLGRRGRLGRQRDDGSGAVQLGSPGSRGLYRRRQTDRHGRGVRDQ
jgi:hypothetical protein